MKEDGKTQKNGSVAAAQPSEICSVRSIELFNLLSHFSPDAFHVLCRLFQRSATKPYTCAIMTSESLGDEFTSVMWNSAHVWQGKSSVRESTTRVRHAFCFCCSALNVSSFFFSWPFFAIFGVMRAKLNRLQWLQRYLLWQLLELMLKSANDKRNIATCWNVLGFVCFYIK